MFKYIRDFIRDYKELSTDYRGQKIDEHCSLQMVGRDEYKYWEGEKSMLIGIDMLTREPQKAISPSAIRRWLPPHENEEITEEKRQEILAEICQLFESQGVSYEIIN